MKILNYGKIYLQNGLKFVIVVFEIVKYPCEL